MACIGHLRLSSYFFSSSCQTYKVGIISPLLHTRKLKIMVFFCLLELINAKFGSLHTTTHFKAVSQAMGTKESSFATIFSRRGFKFATNISGFEPWSYVSSTVRS